jgi:hypothetical protein
MRTSSQKNTAENLGSTEAGLHPESVATYIITQRPLFINLKTGKDDQARSIAFHWPALLTFQSRRLPIEIPARCSCAPKIVEWRCTLLLRMSPLFEGTVRRRAARCRSRRARGVWAGSYVEPWQYRASVRLGGQPAGCSDDANAHP